MKALLCENFGGLNELKIKDHLLPSPAANQLRIEIIACGLNYPDLLMIQNLYQFKPELPFSPGGEVAGIIKEVGSEVSGFEIGDAVFSLCKWGGLAEEAIVDAESTLPIPSGMDFATAASLFYNYGTSYYALKERGRLRPGETLLVLGAAGGVGLAAVELGVRLGAKVIAAASTDEKLAVCKEKGASDVINYSKEDLKSRVKELTDGRGVDVIVDPVGGKYTDLSLRGMAWGGRYLIVGFAGGEIPEIPANLPLLKGCSVIGVFWGRYSREYSADAHVLLEELGRFHKEGLISPQLFKMYSLEESITALKDLANRNVIGKAVVAPQGIQKALESVHEKNNGESFIEQTIFETKEDIFKRVGKELGTSSWMKISQQIINEFADATGDHQWIHIDKERAVQTPFGGTIAHGYLTLSLIPNLLSKVYSASFSQMGINYGTEKVRFLNPVLSGSWVRAKARLKHASEMPKGGIKMTVECTIEIKGAEKSACYAEVISVLY